MEVTDGEIIGYLHRLNGNEFEQALGDSEGQGILACCSPRGSRVGLWFFLWSCMDVRVGL